MDPRQTRRRLHRRRLKTHHMDSATKGTCRHNTGKRLAALPQVFLPYLALHLRRKDRPLEETRRNPQTHAPPCRLRHIYPSAKRRRSTLPARKLTCYRIGPGNSQTTTCNDLPKVVCTCNKYTYDDDVLSRYIDIKEINKIINYLYISHLTKIYIFNTKFDCIFKYKIFYLSFVKRSFVATAKRMYPLREAVLLAWVSPLLGSKRVAEIYYRRWCRMLQKPAE